ncbi:hypothetical protein [Vulgatibacter sp.]|uniref:hypothetical protein n=1 Tax=Vulgatibacter sp. TaxID=1971226 RepID=UPI00356AD61A
MIRSTWMAFPMALALAGCSGGEADDAAGGGRIGGIHATRVAAVGLWNVTLPSVHPAYHRATSSLQLAFREDGTLVLAWDRQMAEARYRNEGEVLVLEPAQDELPLVVGRPDAGTCPAPYGFELRIDALEVVGLDDDGDGAADRIEGTLDAVLYAWGEGVGPPLDTAYPSGFEGTADGEAPEWYATGTCVVPPVGAAGGFHFDEPVEVQAAEARLADGTRTTFDVQLDGGVDLSLAPRTPLPLGAELVLAVQVADLGGNETELLLPCSVPAPAPGEPTGDFEGDDLAGWATSGAVESFVGTQGVPAPGGEKALVGHAVFAAYRVIEVPEVEAPALQLRLQLFAESPQFFGLPWPVEIVIAAGEVEVVEALELDGEAGWEVPSERELLPLAPVREVAIDVGALRGTQAVVGIRSGTERRCAPAGVVYGQESWPAVVVDDVHIAP